MATSCSGGRSRSTWREPPTMGKQLVTFTTRDCESSAPFFVIYQSEREPPTVLLIDLYELLSNPTTELIESPSPSHYGGTFVTFVAFLKNKKCHPQIYTLQELDAHHFRKTVQCRVFPWIPLAVCCVDAVIIQVRSDNKVLSHEIRY